MPTAGLVFIKINKLVVCSDWTARVVEKVKAKVYRKGSETSNIVWFGDGAIDQKRGGRFGDGRVKNAEILFGSDRIRNEHIRGIDQDREARFRWFGHVLNRTGYSGRKDAKDGATGQKTMKKSKWEVHGLWCKMTCSCCKRFRLNSVT